MQMDSEIAQLLTQADSRINSFNISGGNPEDMKSFVAEINRIKSEIANKIENQNESEKRFWNEQKNKIKSLNRKIDDKNNSGY